jgi:antagonist of KipI
MSLKILKAGILDSVQDLGRTGFRQLGINPGGAMDHFAASSANFLVGNEADEAVIEMHFPAAELLFQQQALVAVTGAEGLITVNGEAIPSSHPVWINKNSVVQFRRFEKGTRIYLALREKLRIEPMLNSYSINLKAGFGGYKGRALQKNDEIEFRDNRDHKISEEKDFVVLPWKIEMLSVPKKIAVTPGNEWDQLGEASKRSFLDQPFVISTSADRMGYRLNGSLQSTVKEELVSSAVNFGTIQLLPGGEPIILMADHQTAGGYPRIAHVVSAHLHFLAQSKPGDSLRFELVDEPKAEELLIKQQQHLLQLQNACKFRLEEFLHAYH